MDRTEFMEKLQRSLAGGVNSARVAENVQYYREYIDVEIRKGRSEKEVLEGLGDPRLLAKSIIEANKRAGVSEGTNRTCDEETVDDSYGAQGREKTVHMPGWLIALIAVVILLLIIGVVFSVVSFLAPIIIPVLLVILIVNYFKGK